MANNKVTSGSRVTSGKWLWITLGLVALIVAALSAYRTQINGYAAAGTAYSARVACSCRFVGNRALGDCEKDQLAGMELISLSEDAEAKSVTATFPLIRSDTATYREGYGCVLQEWRD